MWDAFGSHAFAGGGGGPTGAASLLPSAFGAPSSSNVGGGWPRGASCGRSRSSPSRLATTSSSSGAGCGGGGFGFGSNANGSDGSSFSFGGPLGDVSLNFSQSLGGCSGVQASSWLTSSSASASFGGLPLSGFEDAKPAAAAAHAVQGGGGTFACASAFAGQQPAATKPPASAPLAAPPGVHQRDVCDADFERLRVIGRGASATVHAARHTATGALVALKEIPRRVLRMHRTEEALKREINLHRTLRHPNVLRLHTYYKTPDSVVLVLELCPGGTLRDVLDARAGEGLPDRDAARCARHVCRGMAYLHARGVLHRDLKLENVLIGADGACKVADFGWSVAIHPLSGGGGGGTGAIHAHAAMGLGSAGSSAGASPPTRHTRCGTLDYVSPEMAAGTGHAAPTDVWSLGAMLAELLSGTAPFYHPSTEGTLRAIRCDAPMLRAGVAPSAAALVCAMLDKDAAARPTVRDVLAAPWVQRQLGDAAPPPPKQWGALPMTSSLQQQHHPQHHELQADEQHRW